jgi:uncharacterized protein
MSVDYPWATLVVAARRVLSTVPEQVLFPLVLAIIAATYAAVGQAGGTGYIAAMGLIGLSPDVIRPTALALNIIVAAIGAANFARAGLLKWPSFYPFAILGAPFSVLGGATHLSQSVYEPLVGALLILAAWQMVRSARGAARIDEILSTRPPFLPSLFAGAGIGFVSGLTGVGGGIFLAPLVLTFRWAETRQTAAISAVFNLLNSAAALAGLLVRLPVLPSALPLWLLAVGCGAIVGSWLAVQRLPPTALRYILSVLLLVAGLRMLLT